MSETAVVARANPNDPFAISPNGSFLVHAPSGIIQSERIYESIFDVRDVRLSRQVAIIKLPVQAKTGFQFRDVEFCDHGRYLLAVGSVITIYPGQDPASTAGDLITAMSEDFVKILDMKYNSLHADISLSTAEHSFPPEALARYKQINPEWHLEKKWHGEVQFAACAANAPIAAIVINFGNQITVKILNLDTGAETQGFDGIPGQTNAVGLAVSPQGSSFALFGEENVPGAHDLNDHRITTVDLQSKKVIRSVGVKSTTNFASVSIAYAGESTIAAELVDREYLGYSPSDPPQLQYRSHDHASVHFFDVQTGSESQVISDPSVDDFSLKGISADGRIMLAYAGKSRICKSCNGGSGEQEVTDARFTLWNRETGQPIGRSPELKVVHHTCPWFPSLSWGSCVASDETPTLKLSQDGHAVVASWVSGGEPIQVYSLPTQ